LLNKRFQKATFNPIDSDVGNSLTKSTFTKIKTATKKGGSRGSGGSEAHLHQQLS
jgi:hypothetical protein